MFWFGLFFLAAKQSLAVGKKLKGGGDFGLRLLFLFILCKIYLFHCLLSSILVVHVLFSCDSWVLVLHLICCSDDVMFV